MHSIRSKWYRMLYKISSLGIMVFFLILPSLTFAKDAGTDIGYVCASGNVGKPCSKANKGKEDPACETTVNGVKVPGKCIQAPDPIKLQIYIPQVTDKAYVCATGKVGATCDAGNAGKEDPKCAKEIDGLKVEGLCIQQAQIKIDPENPARGVVDYISKLYKFLVILAAMAAVFMLAVAGYRWMFAGGNSGAVDKAKETMRSALAGLLIALFSFTILEIINPELIDLSLPNVAKELTPIEGKEQEFGKGTKVPPQDKARQNLELNNSRDAVDLYTRSAGTWCYDVIDARTKRTVADLVPEIISKRNPVVLNGRERNGECLSEVNAQGTITGQCNVNLNVKAFIPTQSGVCTFGPIDCLTCSGVGAGPVGASTPAIGSGAVRQD